MNISITRQKLCFSKLHHTGALADIARVRIHVSFSLKHVLCTSCTSFLAWPWQHVPFIKTGILQSVLHARELSGSSRMYAAIPAMPSLCISDTSLSKSHFLWTGLVKKSNRKKYRSTTSRIFARFSLFTLRQSTWPLRSETPKYEGKG